jgi:hypothetical protein
VVSGDSFEREPGVILPTQTVVFLCLEAFKRGHGEFAQPTFRILDLVNDARRKGHVDPEDIVALYIDGPDVNAGSNSVRLELRMTRVALQRVGIVKRRFGRVENPHDGVANGFHFAAGTLVTPVSGKQLDAPREVRSTHLSHTLVAQS